MTKQDYLFELGCEEIPTSALLSLEKALRDNIEEQLTQQALGFEAIQSFTTPRRFALIIKNLDAQQPSKKIERRGPNKAAAFDKSGTPTLACLSFANACGVSTEELKIEETDKGAWIVCSVNQVGKMIQELLPSIIQTAIQKLPLSKPMRWGSNEYKFIRPVHWMVSLYGTECIPIDLFGLKSEKITYGHRFHAPQALSIPEATSYYALLSNKGWVMPSFTERREKIKRDIENTAKNIGFSAVLNQDLLTEVTTLVEWPVVLLGKFSESFLAVPQEALISAMESHQKCFAVVNAQEKIQPYFIMVSNIESEDPKAIIDGNQRVIHARLSDASFFFHQDLKHSLSSRLQKLEQVIFQKDLGSLANKAERVSELAKKIARLLNTDQQQAARAGLLCKCDLLSEMVFEFPELQGIMGYYYALHDEETEVTALAIREHYWPRFSGDHLPTSPVSQSVALADKIDTLIGIIGINQLPKSDKDPFALRRAALGIIRILIEKSLNLDLNILLEESFNNYNIEFSNKDALEQCVVFILDRLKNWCLDKEITLPIYNSVIEKQKNNLYDFYLRALAVKNFMALSEAETLSAANKRVNNILKKNSIEKNILTINEKLLLEPAEKNLVDHLKKHQSTIENFYQKKQYTETLKALACFKEPVDNFFDQVMIMAEEAALRQNRLAIVQALHRLFTQVADLGQLQQ